METRKISGRFGSDPPININLREEISAALFYLNHGIIILLKVVAVGSYHNLKNSRIDHIFRFAAIIINKTD